MAAVRALVPLSKRAMTMLKRSRMQKGHDIEQSLPCCGVQRVLCYDAGFMAMIPDRQRGGPTFLGRLQRACAKETWDPEPTENFEPPSEPRRS